MLARRLSESLTDEEAFAPAVVDDLLTGVNEWKAVPDIVKLTLKALSDVVRAQGTCLVDVQKSLAGKASKAETQAVCKATAVESAKAIAEVRQTTDRLLEGKADKGDISGKFVEGIDFSAEHRKLLRDVARLQSDLQELKTEMRDERSHLTLEVLDSKADKGAVATALHRKANKTEMELALSSKADQVELQNLQLTVAVKADSVLLENLANELRSKADRSDIDRALRSEAARVERNSGLKTPSSECLDQRWASIAVEIDSFMRSVKQELETLQIRTSAELCQKADSHELTRLTQMLARKADSELVEGMVDELKKDVKQLYLEETKRSAQRLTKETAETLTRSEEKFRKFEDEMKIVKERMKKDASRNKTEIDEALKTLSQNQTASKNDSSVEIHRLRTEQERLYKQVKELKNLELKKTWEKRLESKAEVSEVSEALLRVQKDTAENLAEIKAEFRKLVTLTEKEVIALLERKANVSDVRDWLSSKADLEIIEQSLQQQVNARQLQNESNYVTTAEFEKHVEHSQKVLSDLHKELVLRSNIKDVCDLLDTKANVDETDAEISALKRELSEISTLKRELSLKLPSSDFHSFKEEQVQVNEVIFGEVCAIRLIWNSGMRSKDGKVFWDALNFNSCPENFDWQDDIITQAPGLYEVNWCFFAKDIEEVTLCVNGQAVCSVIGTTASRHVPSLWLGKICGSSFFDFISLPPEARLSLLYRGESQVEGFIGLKKL